MMAKKAPHRRKPAKALPRIEAIRIKELRTFLQSVGSATRNLIFGVKPGQSLYHYTDLSALKEIVQNHDLWLSHSRYSNDEAEVLLGYRLAADIIRKTRAATRERARIRYLDRLAELIDKTPSPEGVFVCCFCRAENLLSQWRGYGANGTGVSMRFDPGRFDAVIGPNSPMGGLMRLWKVFYKAEEQEYILVNAVEQGYRSWTNRSVDDRARIAADAIEFFIPTFKSRGFSEEDECRLIFTPSPTRPVPPRFRVARGMLIPYYSLRELTGPNALTRLPITGVKVGPSANRQLNLESMRVLLDQAGYAGIPVEASETPYRG